MQPTSSLIQLQSSQISPQIPSSISINSLCDAEPLIEKTIKTTLEGNDDPPTKDSQEFVKWRQLVINLVGTYLLTK